MTHPEPSREDRVLIETAIQRGTEYMLKRGLDPEEAADFGLGVGVKLWNQMKQRPGLSRQPGAEGLVWKIINEAAIDVWRKADTVREGKAAYSAAAAAGETGLPAGTDAPVPGDEGMTRVQIDDAMRVVMEELPNVPEGPRLVFLCLRIENLTQEETAARTNFSLETVRKYAREARAVLMPVLVRRGAID